ncbi:hypothetical protein F5X68DRAFT_216360 [Plectosphaerella plurivora]|uniref:Zn(2)-C6 fungal-type domain-containing protein n=1 Tax=Plectosphaerella plurivora TaxID=936078 RepID=A0A9P8V2U7_9PEZI|nr:hypothetical protein F5X68DRAFT_216360 [Plectosphaerella plurivora]
MTLPKPERVRAFKPKTKTGCLTCKKRRVKCDETRPACNRCTKLSIECAGYKPVGSANHGGSSHRPRLLPKHAAPAWPAAVVRSPGASPAAAFLNQQDFIYFRFFREQSTRILAGPYKDNLWERVILQACHEEPSIRALAASVGALELSMSAHSISTSTSTSRSTTPGYPLDGPGRTADHRFYALDHYGRALAGVRRLADLRRPGATRHALIAAILIYCFECICDGPEKAIRHFEKALYFLGDELARYGRPYRHLTTTSPTPDLEGELVAAFVRLDSGLLGRPASYKTARVQRFLVTCDFSDLSLPPSFSSIDEARNYLEQAQFFCMPQLVGSWAEAMTQGGLELSPEVLHVARQTSVRIGLWMTAFEPLLKRAFENRARGEAFDAEFSLKIQALMSNLAAQAIWSFADDAGEYRGLARDLVADSHTINALSRAIANGPGFKKTFVWNNSILQGLITVISAAPNRAARAEALEIIKSVRPRRECAWDSVALAQTGEICLAMSIDLNPFGKVKSNKFHVFTDVWNREEGEQLMGCGVQGPKVLAEDLMNEHSWLMNSCPPGVANRGGVEILQQPGPLYKCV